MDNKTRLIVLSVLGIMAVFLGGLEVGKFAFGGRPTPQTATFSGVTSSSTLSQGENQAQNVSGADTADASSADLLAKCIASVKSAAEKAGTGYEAGDILVSFSPSIDYPEAAAILDSNGLKMHNSASSKTDFAANHWLSVTVGKGEEFKEICILRGQSGVKFAGLNYTFKLAQ